MPRNSHSPCVRTMSREVSAVSHTSLSMPNTMFSTAGEINIPSIHICSTSVLRRAQSNELENYFSYLFQIALYHHLFAAQLPPLFPSFLRKSCPYLSSPPQHPYTSNYQILHVSFYAFFKNDFAYVCFLAVPLVDFILPHSRSPTATHLCRGKSQRWVCSSAGQRGSRRCPGYRCWLPTLICYTQCDHY